MIKRYFLNGFGFEEALIGFLLILALGLLLCWVWKPRTPSDSFAKGASVFAVLAALVPASKPLGTPVSSYILPDEKSTAVARSAPDTCPRRRGAGCLPSWR